MSRIPFASSVDRHWPYRLALAPARRLLRRRRQLEQQAAVSGVGAVANSVPVLHPRAHQLPTDTEGQRAIVQQVEGLKWYHSIDVGHGVRTPGEFDHGPLLDCLPFPESLEGKRCLDVATFDGFWAFEMERRGAAEVIALDIESWDQLDLPAYAKAGFSTGGFGPETGAAFRLAARLLGSRVQRRICNVYDLSPREFGEFDLVVCGDLLVHLTNPLRALQNVWSVTRGSAFLIEPYLPTLDAAGLGPIALLDGHLEEVRWWHLSRAYLERAIRLAGFARVDDLGSLDLRVRHAPDAPAPRAAYRAWRAASPRDTAPDEPGGGDR